MVRGRIRVKVASEKPYGCLLLAPLPSGPRVRVRVRNMECCDKDEAASSA